MTIQMEDTSDANKDNQFACEQTTIKKIKQVIEELNVGREPWVECTAFQIRVLDLFWSTVSRCTAQSRCSR